MSEHLLLRQIPGCQQIDQQLSLPEPIKHTLSAIQIDPTTFFGDIHIDTLGLSLLCMALILIVLGLIARSLVADGPGGKAQATLEGVYKFVADFSSGAIGHDYKTFFPLIAAIFIFVLIGNFIGVGPWKFFEYMPWWPKTPGGEPWELASPTTDFNLTAGLALISLLTYLGSGFWKHGAHYARTLLFSPFTPIEAMDAVVRPATLAVRLMVVITADELLRAAVLVMQPILLPSFVMAFELFIGVIQAFVFALLTSIYIGMTVQHD
jgi:F-type H+-transporting ATPase subunit a